MWQKGSDMLRRYLISIETKDSVRYQSFFSKNKFTEDGFNIFGVVGKNISVQEYFDRAVLGARFPLTPSELGCKESHLACMTDFLASDATYALVLEDDAYCKFDFDFDFDFSIFGNNFLLYLGDMSTKKSKYYYGVDTKLKFIGQHVWRIHPYFLSSVFGAYAYVIDRQCAEKYQKFLQQPTVSDDWITFQLQWNKHMNFYVTDGFSHPKVDDEDYSSNIACERHQRNHSHAKNQDFKTFMQLFLVRKLWRCGQLIYRLFLQRYPHSL
jgi:glycosyl transferase, family 25